MQPLILSAFTLTLSTAAFAPLDMAIAAQRAPLSSVNSGFPGSELIALKRTVSTEIAENGFTVHVSRGIGLVLNLSGIGEGVTKVWLSDPSQLVFSSQDSVIYLKPIQSLSFDGNYHSADGTTMLSVVTQSGKVYQFRIVITSEKPAYTALDVTQGGASTFPSNYPSVTARQPRSIRPPSPVVSRSTTSTTGSFPAPETSAGTPDSSQTTWKTLRPFVSPTTPEVKAPVPVPPPSVVTPAPVVEPETEPETVTDSEKESKPAAYSTVDPIPESQIAFTRLPKVFKPDSFGTPAKETASRSQDETPQALAETKVEPASDEIVSDSEPDSDLAKSGEPESDKKVAIAKTAIPEHIVLANAIARGLPVGVSKKQIGRWSSTYYQIQQAIRILRFGRADSLQEAAKLSGVKVSVLDQLHQWGGG